MAGLGQTAEEVKASLAAGGHEFAEVSLIPISSFTIEQQALIKAAQASSAAEGEIQFAPKAPGVQEPMTHNGNPVVVDPSGNVYVAKKKSNLLLYLGGGLVAALLLGFIKV